jgi:hypothetical protein
LWRLVKNASRLATGRWEYPANADWWHEALTRSGFQHVSIDMLAHEGGIAVAETPVGSDRATSADLQPLARDGALVDRVSA